MNWHLIIDSPLAPKKAQLPIAFWLGLVLCTSQVTTKAGGFSEKPPPESSFPEFKKDLEPRDGSHQAYHKNAPKGRSDLTPEQIQQREEFMARTKDMTPEQRREEAMKSGIFNHGGSADNPHPRPGPQDGNGDSHAKSKEHSQGGEQQNQRKTPPGERSPQEQNSNSQDNNGNSSRAPQRPNPGFYNDLTPEQKQEFDDFRNRTKDMSPEERKAEAQKIPFLKERMMHNGGQGGPGEGRPPGGGGGPGEFQGGQPDDSQRAKLKERLDRGSSEDQERAELKQRMRDKSPEERQQAIEKFKSEHPDFSPQAGGGPRPERGGGPRGDRPNKFDHEHSERLRKQLNDQMQGLSPEEKKKIDDFRANSTNMTPDQRRDAANTLPMFRNLTSEQRELLEQRSQELQEMSPDQQQKLMKNYEKWKKMSPQQQDEMRKKMKEKSSSGSPEGTVSSDPAPAQNI
jgi:hypothetical protein